MLDVDITVQCVSRASIDRSSQLLLSKLDSVDCPDHLIPHILIFVFLKKVDFMFL